jgi:hypothetical protein
MRNTIARRRLPIYAGMALVLAAAGAQAAPPKVELLFPAGAARGAGVPVSVTGTFDKWPVQVWTNRQDVTVEPAEEKGKLNVVVAADAVPGLCFIRLYNDEGASALRPFVIGILPEVNEKEPNDESSKAQVLESSSTTVNGRFEKSGDVDVFAVKLKRGETLVASMDANRTLGSPLDGVLQILSSGGFILEHSDDDPSLDPQIVFTAPADGTYLVRTFCFPAVADSTIGLAGKPNFLYRLTLTTGGFADHPVPLAVSRNQPAEVQFVGWNIPENLRLPLTIGENATELTISDREIANTTAVSVEPHATVLEVEPNDAKQPQRVEIPVTISGHIDRPRDIDAFAFAAKKGASLRIRVESRELGFPLDPVLVVADAAGKTITRVDDSQQTNRDAETTFNPPADGDYRVFVTDLHGRGGMRFAYRLTIAPPQPDFSLSLAADAFVATPGKPLEIAVTVDRRNGFDDEIELSAIGLPEGVTIATEMGGAAKPEDSGNRKGRRGGGSAAASLKFVLNATSGPHSVPLRIVGQAKDKPEQVRTASVAIPGSIVRSENVWLTVLKAP